MSPVNPLFPRLFFLVKLFHQATGIKLEHISRSFLKHVYFLSCQYSFLLNDFVGNFIHIINGYWLNPYCPIRSYLFSCKSLAHIHDFIYNSLSFIKAIFVSLVLEFSSVAWWAHQWVHQRLLVITFGFTAS